MGMGDDFLELKCECPNEECHLKVRLPLAEVVEFHGKGCVLIVDRCAEPIGELVAVKTGYAWHKPA